MSDPSTSAGPAAPPTTSAPPGTPPMPSITAPMATPTTPVRGPSPLGPPRTPNAPQYASSPHLMRARRGGSGSPSRSAARMYPGSPRGRSMQGTGGAYDRFASDRSAAAHYGYAPATAAWGPAYQDTEASDGGLFVHHTAIANHTTSFRSLAEDESVEFDLIRGTKGYYSQNVTGPAGSPVIGDVKPSYHHHHHHHHHGGHHHRKGSHGSPLRRNIASPARGQAQHVDGIPVATLSVTLPVVSQPGSGAPTTAVVPSPMAASAIPTYPAMPGAPIPPGVPFLVMHNGQWFLVPPNAYVPYPVPPPPPPPGSDASPSLPPTDASVTGSPMIGANLMYPRPHGSPAAAPAPYFLPYGYPTAAAMAMAPPPPPDASDAAGMSPMFAPYGMPRPTTPPFPPGIRSPGMDALDAQFHHMHLVDRRSSAGSLPGSPVVGPVPVAPPGVVPFPMAAAAGMVPPPPPPPMVVPAGIPRMRRRRCCSSPETPKPFDWTYSTDFRGLVSSADVLSTDEEIPLAKLAVREPILYFDENVMFEDELGDNGVSKYSVKIRVMPSGFFILARQFLRVDHVQYAFYDTRIYHAFGSDHVLREYLAQSIDYDTVLARATRETGPPMNVAAAPVRPSAAVPIARMPMRPTMLAATG
ncbi:hypothetical protein AMAG_18577 [Allomyces macrogynus ATCC 38327]|uniref:CSD domain-containing protein n=1 Tax=Allomyces macrogynus (strain ATCC 38327) TaxID=578462 RepID=A0A0L0SE34_ALLM3|nr:hypothetical protein AMAG_18577 [Allomyces macrogynus ATCC 38327]|eukprot:KNE60650.1 hypothetical protein AMAG_18577 [Allomyces macrogynus ATCC 38327]